MNNYTDPNFTPEALESFQGYSLQAFASGRIKLSFHRTHTQRNEYYADRPKRDAEAYHRQRRRSAEALHVAGSRRRRHDYYPPDI